MEQRRGYEEDLQRLREEQDRINLTEPRTRVLGHPLLCSYLVLRRPDFTSQTWMERCKKKTCSSDGMSQVVRRAVTANQSTLCAIHRRGAHLPGLLRCYSKRKGPHHDDAFMKSPAPLISPQPHHMSTALHASFMERPRRSVERIHVDRAAPRHLLVEAVAIHARGVAGLHGGAHDKLAA